VVVTVPANRAILSVGRYTVTLPACPNWSESLAAEFTNACSGNYGCANVTNLGLMVASPADLVSGRTLAPADAQPAATLLIHQLSAKAEGICQAMSAPCVALRLAAHCVTCAGS